VRNGDGAVRGLAGLRAVALSPDGRFVYGASALDAALTVFARDPDGELAFVESLPGVLGATALATSPDGLHLYVGGSAGVDIFSRTSSGRLSRGASVAFAGVHALAVSPDGGNVYAAALDSGVIAVLRRDPITGALVAQQSITGVAAPAGLAVSADGRSVYVTSFTDASLAVFAREAGTGLLSGIELFRDGVGATAGLQGAAAVTVSPDGQRVYAVGQQAMAVFSRSPDTGRLVFVESKSYFAATVDCPPAPASAIAVSPDHQFLFVARSADAAVAVFRRDPGTGSLVLADIFEDALGGRGCDGAFGLAAAIPAGGGVGDLYVSGLSVDRLTALAVDVADGALTPVSEQRNGGGGVDGLVGVRVVAVSPDDQHVYAAAPGALAVFARDSSDGALRFIEVQRGGVSGLGTLSGMALSPDGAHVYAATASDRLFVFVRDAASGRLQLVQELRNGVNGVSGLAGDSAVRVSPDGVDVYVASAGDAAIAVFGRDTATGMLGFSGVHRQGEWGADGLEGASGLAIDADGRHVYVASTGAGGAVAAFVRNAASGELSFRAVYRNRVAGIDGLAGAAAVELSPDGTHVYVAGFLDAAIAIFARDAVSGDLGFSGVVRDAGGGLSGVTALAASADGGRIYAAGAGGTLVVLSRAPGVGALQVVGTWRSGTDGAAGLAGARSVATDGAGANVYVAGAIDAAVAAFSVAP